MRSLFLFLALCATARAQGVITTCAGTDFLFPSDGKPAVDAPLLNPRGLATDAQGNLYIADAGLAAVLRVDRQGTITVVAGNGLRRFAGDGGLARAASVAAPYAVTVDRDGIIYIAEDSSHKIRRIDRNGVITTIAGNAGFGSSPDGTPANQSQIAFPRAIVTDSAGNIYFAELNANRVRIGRDGILRTLAGNGQLGTSGDGGNAMDAAVQHPACLAIDHSDTLSGLMVCAFNR